jgi:hypothetical protein
MEGFKQFKKVQCFKEGGTVQRQIANYEKRERKTEMTEDTAQDKSMVKKGVRQHEAALHKGEPKTELKLKCGGRAKKEGGSIRKFENASGQYGAKKTAEDKKNIAEAKKFKKGGKVKKYEDGGSVFDSIKGLGTDLKNNILGTPEQNRIAQEQMDKQAAKGSKLAKFFGGKAPQPAPGPLSDKDVQTKCAGGKMKRGGKACK